MTSPSSAGWHADPEHPTSLQRYWDGERWTDQSRPTGYVTQPAGAPPASAPGGPSTPVFGAAPPETGGPEAARRRLRAGVVTLGVIAALALLALVLVLVGVLG